MIGCAGVITGAGFETPAEALYLNKKIMCLPILGQYEQLCNAAALEKLNATIVHKIDEHFSFAPECMSSVLTVKMPKEIGTTFFCSIKTSSNTIEFSLDGFLIL